jgi:predicted PurR-regulated permease PerM
MLGIDARAARCTWTAVLIVAALYLIYLIRCTLFVFVLAVLLAFLLAPLVDLLDRLLPASRTRFQALAIVYTVVVLSLVTLAYQVGSRAVDQATRLVSEFPAMAARWEQPPAAGVPVTPRAQMIARVRAGIRDHSGEFVGALPAVGRRVVELASNLIYVIIVPVLAFLFIKEGPVIRQQILDSAPDEVRRRFYEDILGDVHTLLAHYMRAMVILAAASFTATVSCLLILGMPYAILLATLAGLLEFIPLAGPVTSAAAILIVGAVSGANMLPLALFLLVFRLLQDYGLSPHLMGRGVEVHPLLVLFGVFAGAEIAGIPGTFLSVPLLALVRTFYLRLRKAHTAAAQATLEG